jgi:hypothetical protein
MPNAQIISRVRHFVRAKVEIFQTSKVENSRLDQQKKRFQCKSGKSKSETGKYFYKPVVNKIVKVKKNLFRVCLAKEQLSFENFHFFKPTTLIRAFGKVTSVLEQL